MKTRTVGSTGEEKRLDLNFIQVDKTTRDEVTKKLAWMDIGVKDQRLFWGMWYKSSSGVGGLMPVAEIPLPAGERRWFTHNLLVEFNANGVVQRFGDFSDSKVNEELEHWLKEVGKPPLNLSAPLVIHTGSQSITLTDDLAQFVLGNGSTFNVPRQDIIKLKMYHLWRPGDQGPFHSDIYVEFGFSREKPAKQGCKCLLVQVSPADYLTLLQYIPQAATRR